MDEEVHRLNLYTEDLRADRRPAKELLSDEQALHARQAAALLSGITLGAGIPSRQFRTHLEGQIAQWIGRVRNDLSAASGSGGAQEL